MAVHAVEGALDDDAGVERGLKLHGDLAHLLPQKLDCLLCHVVAHVGLAEEQVVHDRDESPVVSARQGLVEHARDLGAGLPARVVEQREQAHVPLEAGRALAPDRRYADEHELLARVRVEKAAALGHADNDYLERAGAGGLAGHGCAPEA